MATIYTQTDNYGLNLYGDDDPADLRDGHNSNMVKIDAALKTHSDDIAKNRTDITALKTASDGYQVLEQAQSAATQAQDSATASANSASHASQSESASAINAANANMSASRAAISAEGASESATSASESATTATNAAAKVPTILTAANESAAMTLSMENPTAWVFYPEAA